MTEDETWIHNYDLLNQQEAKTWKKPGAKTPTGQRVTQSDIKLIMTIVWDCEGVLLVGFPPHGTTINSSYYASLLHQLHSSIREKRREKVMHGVLLLHDNTHVHKSNITQASVQYTGFIEFNHLAYSPDIAPNDYHLFSKLKNFLRGRNFERDNNHESLFGVLILIFSRSIESLRNR